jgi:hypothetical protein
MKKLIAIALAFIPYYAAAQSTAFKLDKTTVCDNTKKLIDEIIAEYKEIPAWTGYEEKSGYVLLINPETDTWTFIQYMKNTACVLGVGEGSKLFVAKP